MSAIRLLIDHAAAGNILIAPGLLDVKNISALLYG